jgi:hypothetical protein
MIKGEPTWGPGEAKAALVIHGAWNKTEAARICEWPLDRIAFLFSGSRSQSINLPSSGELLSIQPVYLPGRLRVPVRLPF